MEVVLVALSWFLNFIWWIKWMDLVFKAHSRLNMALQLLEQVVEKRRSMWSKESWTERSIRIQRSLWLSSADPDGESFGSTTLMLLCTNFGRLVSLVNFLLFCLLFLINQTQLFGHFFLSCVVLTSVLWWKSGFKVLLNFHLWRRAWSLLSFYRFSFALLLIWSLWK